MSIQWPKIAVLATYICACGVSTGAQERVNPAVQARAEFRRYQVQPLEMEWSWLTSEWSGSDKPFLQTKQEIKNLESQGKLTNAILQKLRSVAAKSPTDAKAQFRWGYALWSAPYAGIDLGVDNHKTYQPIVRALNRPTNPHSREYDRLRFLLTTLYYPYTKLKTVGERLFLSDGKDAAVKTYLTNYLAVSRDPADRKRALTFANELVTEHPKSPDARLSLAVVYRRALFSYGELSAADKSVAAYQQYLALLPKDERTRRTFGLAAIRLLKKEKARQQRDGFKPPLMAN